MKVVEREREKSCDEKVIQFQYDPHGYASALLMLEKANYLRKPLAVAASGRKNDLLHRIECMLGVQKKEIFSFNKLAGLFAGLLCFIVLNALLIMSKPAHKTDMNSSFADVTSPLYFFAGSDGEEHQPSSLPAPKEIQNVAIVNHAQQPQSPSAPEEEKAEAGDYNREAAAFPSSYTAPSPLTFVNLSYTVLPELMKYQEEQVKEAVEVSKKVLEEKHWKDVEKGIADAMSTDEKAVLKNEYEKELSRVDWDKMKDQLRLAYDQIDWNRVNEDLSKAMVEIKIDSLKQAYSTTLSELTSLQKELCENNLKGIPDTDISLQSVEQNKKEVQKAINTLIKARTKKIVRL